MRLKKQKQKPKEYAIDLQIPATGRHRYRISVNGKTIAEHLPIQGLRERDKIETEIHNSRVSFNACKLLQITLAQRKSRMRLCHVAKNDKERNMLFAEGLRDGLGEKAIDYPIEELGLPKIKIRNEPCYCYGYDLGESLRSMIGALKDEA